MEGIKHLIECHCKLPQYAKSIDGPYHQFVVFSIIDDSNTVIPKHVACNNCGVIHKVYDIGKSELMAGQETGAVMTIEDVALMLPESIKNVLISYKCDISCWENVLFVFQNEKFPSDIVVDRKLEDDIVSGKILSITNYGQYTIKPFSRKISI